ncbi:MAG: hypothetical protein ACPHCJ_06340 [Oceanococcaceae bacterium]
MGSKDKDEFEDDALDIDGGEELEELNASEDFSRKLTTMNGVGRVRRNWRDVERAREEREMRRLLNAHDDWYSDLDKPQRSRTSR